MTTKQARYAQRRKQEGWTRLNCFLSPESTQRLERLCKSSGLSKQDVVTSALFLLEAQK